MKKLLSLLLVFFAAQLSAQEIEMADQMRSNGKIYVVLAVLLIILFGLIGYLISIDRKLGKMEKKIKN